MDYRKNKKEVELEYIVDFAPFTVLLNGGTNQYIINRFNDLELTMLSENTAKSAGSDYKVSYSVEGGIGTISRGEEELTPGTEYTFERGTSGLEYFPTTLGEHVITVTCTAPDGLVKKVQLTILVENVTFFHKCLPVTNNGSVGEEMVINVSLQTTDLEDEIDYEIAYYFGEDSEGAGTVKDAEGKVVAAAQQSSINPVIMSILSLVTL